MLGFLLARAGVEVEVLEKHKDFFRDFRGDTLHPSTLEIMRELGLLEELLRQPHEEMREIAGHFGGQVAHFVLRLFKTFRRSASSSLSCPSGTF